MPSEWVNSKKDFKKRLQFDYDRVTFDLKEGIVSHNLRDSNTSFLRQFWKINLENISAPRVGLNSMPNIEKNRRKKGERDRKKEKGIKNNCEKNEYIRYRLSGTHRGSQIPSMEKQRQ